jgi:two-component system, chemotaxis family, chemotaxis protein CheY
MKKILLIEDDPLLCWLLEKILTKKYDVTVMNDGKEAWSWLTSNNIPDIIVTDLKMPSLGGMELLENVTSDETLKNIPIIIHSGYEEAGKRKKCLDLGAFSYLVKPFEPEYLVSEVERAIESRNENILAGNK